MKITVNLAEKKYDIIIENNSLSKLDKLVNLNRKVMIISDEGVPTNYIQTIRSQCEQSFTCIVKQGEESKSLATYQQILSKLLENEFSRKDCIVAIGGGVIGDLAGFVAATYMRGIEFFNIPTTTLAQIDSSIGGKVAINLNGVKNSVGCFYHPSLVLIDPTTLTTLTKRHYHNGLVEALKAGMIYDPTLYEMFVKGEYKDQIQTIIYRSLLVKKDVVEKDEKEQNLRKILNFGHTIGHAIESAYGLKDLYHGECVAIGIYRMSSDSVVRKQLDQIYGDLQLQTSVPFDEEEILSFIRKDKKANQAHVDIVLVPEIGKAVIKKITIEEMRNYLRG